MDSALCGKARDACKDNPVELLAGFDEVFGETRLLQREPRLRTKDTEELHFRLGLEKCCRMGDSPDRAPCRRI